MGFVRTSSKRVANASSRKPLSTSELEEIVKRIGSADESTMFVNKDKKTIFKAGAIILVEEIMSKNNM